MNRCWYVLKSKDDVYAVSFGNRPDSLSEEGMIQELKSFAAAVDCTLVYIAELMPPFINQIYPIELSEEVEYCAEIIIETAAEFSREGVI